MIAHRNLRSSMASNSKEPDSHRNHALQVSKLAASKSTERTRVAPNDHLGAENSHLNSERSKRRVINLRDFHFQSPRKPDIGGGAPANPTQVVSKPAQYSNAPTAVHQISIVQGGSASELKENSKSRGHTAQKDKMNSGMDSSRKSLKQSPLEEKNGSVETQLQTILGTPARAGPQVQEPAAVN